MIYNAICFHQVTSPTCTLGILSLADSRHHQNLLLCPSLIVPLIESKGHLALKENSTPLQHEATAEETLFPFPLKNSV